MFDIEDAQKQKFIHFAKGITEREDIKLWHEVKNGALVLSLDKSLSTEKRPNMRSHILNIIISELIFQDYSSTTDAQFEVYFKRMGEIKDNFNFKSGPSDSLTVQNETSWVIKSDGSVSCIA